VIEFGRYAVERRADRGLGKPETFNFLGFTHTCRHTRSGGFQLKRKTRRDRLRGRLRAVKEGLRRRILGPTRVLSSAPKVGAECLNRARWDLCGGRAAMRVPTAIQN